MPDDWTAQVRQIAQYPLATPGPNDVLLFQAGGIGGPYRSVTAPTLFQTALDMDGWLHLAPGNGIAWNGAALTYNAGLFNFSEPLAVPTLQAGEVFVNGQAVVTQQWVTEVFDAFLLNSVWSFNGRTGAIILTTDDVRRAGAVPAVNPTLSGIVTIPTIWNYADTSDSAASTAFVQGAIQSQVQRACIVGSFNGRGGNVLLSADDVTYALTQPGVFAQANTPPSGDTSKRLATTLFVDDAMFGLAQEVQANTLAIVAIQDQQYAPLASPQFTGIPTAPTAAQTVNSGQLATTAFVHAAVVASTTGVSSFNTRTGAVTLTLADVTGVGGAPLASPAFTGNATATTQAPGDNSTRVATTAFVDAALSSVTVGVSSFNTRTGAVTLTAADVTGVGGALLASPAFSGTPTAPTAAPATNNTQLATTAYVTNAITALPAPVTSFNGRTGAITFQGSDISAAGGALLVSPAFTGVATAPTAATGTSNTQIATTAFVAAAITASGGGVTSFNTRTGAVSLTAADVTGVGGALLAGPTFTGVPAAPTATAGTNSTQIATTAFVQTALAAAPGGVSSFNGRTGAITFLGSDISAAGGALLASPSFSGTPDAPTAAPGTSTSQIATTQFVTNAIASAGGVNTFNGRAGAVTLLPADIVGASGGVLLTVAASTPPTGVAATANHAFWWDSNAGQLYLNYNDGTSTQWVAASSLTSPAAPQFNYQAWVYATAGAATFTTPANSSVATVYRVRLQAGGGGAGGYAASGTYFAGGGGAGEFCEGTLTGIAGSTAVTLGIGANGNGGGTGGAAGTAGTTTTLSVGTLNLTVNGGAAGAGSASGNGGAGGRGGTVASTGGWTLILDLPGQGGQQGTAASPSFGGASGLGLGGVSGATANFGPSGYGAGGGSTSTGGTTAAAGQPGGVGAVIIERMSG